jgi:DNA polymerase-3 subunit alpha
LVKRGNFNSKELPFLKNIIQLLERTVELNNWIKHVNLKQSFGKFELKKYNNNFPTILKFYLKIWKTFQMWLLRICTIWFSVLQSTISIPKLIENTVKQNACGCSTDIGNMMGAFQFVSGILNHNKSAETS